MTCVFLNTAFRKDLLPYMLHQNMEALMWQSSCCSAELLQTHQEK